MSGECERCGHHCMDCSCADKAPDLSPVERFHVVDLHPSVGTGSFMELDELGDWVRASDYIALAARVDSLTKEATSYHDAYEGEKQGRAIEVEALTKERDVAVDMLRECRAQRDAALARGQKDNAND